MRRINNIVAKNWILISVILVGIFLRFYRLEGFVTFLGDQGRDAIIIKRILTGEHFPAIGAPTSVGQVYLGPFYYYFIAPWLLLFKFQPIGLAFGVAVFSSLYLLINYLIVKELFDKKIALISTIFLSFSSVLIDFSRFSWNPNLLPLFALLTIYFVIKSLQTNKWYYFILLGAFLSFSIQLHYLALFLIPPIGILFLSSLYQKSIKQLISQFYNFFISVLSFIIFSSPLIIFDLRHNFLNSKLFLALFKSSGTSFASKINSFFDSFYYLNFYSFNINLNKIFIYVLLVFLLIILFTLIKKSSNSKIFLLTFFITILGMSLYSGPKYPHYFGILFPLYFIIISYFLASLNQSSFGKIMIVFFISGYIFLNFQKYYFLRNQPNNQIAHAEKVAQFLNKKIGKEKFNFAVQPDGDPEDAYLYFLELKGKVPLDRKKLEVGNEMFVVCGNDCDLKNTKSWNINMFGKFKIVNQWKTEGIKIYKLIR
jgi:4-amino-4-deoxy-L-arabinose transferase-like glycosyltransferase